MITILAMLACYRLSRMIATERGPWSVFERLRGWVAKSYQPITKHLAGGVSYEQPHWLHEGVGCPLCISVYVGLLFAIPLSTDVIEYIYTALALSGAASLLYKLER